MFKHRPSTSSETRAQSWRTSVMRQTALPRAQMKHASLTHVTNRQTQGAHVAPARGVSAPISAPSQAKTVHDPVSDSETWDWGSDFDSDASGTDSDGTFDRHTREIARSQAEWTDFSRRPPPPPPRRPTSQRSPTRVPTGIFQLHSTFNITRKES